jgi:ABC-type polysaccharide/polyol phosphate export permease
LISLAFCELRLLIIAFIFSKLSFEIVIKCPVFREFYKEILQVVFYIMGVVYEIRETRDT